MTTIHKFGATPISCHAWSGNRSELALSHNSKDVTLYNAKGQGWEKTAVLDQHDLRVTGIDWAPTTNRIVTCSSDRNAYVWVKGPDGQWKYTLVLLRINRAATCVRWSPEENKFAVGSGAKIISVCYYEKDNDWWVAKHIKKPLKSTITSIDWHPNNILLAAGSSDFKVRVYSGFIKEIEPKPSATPWGARMPMGNLMTEFSNSPNGGGWVHAVSFSPDGSKLAWAGHDSSISVADAANDMLVMKLKTNLLPMCSLTWIRPNTIAAAGHNCVPYTFIVESDAVKLGSAMEEDKKKESSGKTSAMDLFKNKDKLGQNELETKLNFTHQKQIAEIRIVGGQKGDVDTFSTCSLDGKIVVWNLKTLAGQMKGLKI
eukprot:GFUD01037067.1.p1 GENE.GFUD01037067.1~~GFUD01037067.1.p1  ORF type:complete len:372 (+),score=123.95 GFUD01037067.1:349-1464(+)